MLKLVAPELKEFFYSNFFTFAVITDYSKWHYFKKQNLLKEYLSVKHDFINNEERKSLVHLWNKQKYTGAELKTLKEIECKIEQHKFFVIKFDENWERVFEKFLEHINIAKNINEKTKEGVKNTFKSTFCIALTKSFKANRSIPMNSEEKEATPVFNITIFSLVLVDFFKLYVKPLVTCDRPKKRSKPKEKLKITRNLINEVLEECAHIINLLFEIIEQENLISWKRKSFFALKKISLSNLLNACDLQSLPMVVKPINYRFYFTQPIPAGGGYLNRDARASIVRLKGPAMVSLLQLFYYSSQHLSVINEIQKQGWKISPICYWITSGLYYYFYTTLVAGLLPSLLFNKKVKDLEDNVMKYMRIAKSVVVDSNSKNQKLLANAISKFTKDNYENLDALFQILRGEKFILSLIPENGIFTTPKLYNVCFNDYRGRTYNTGAYNIIGNKAYRDFVFFNSTVNAFERSVLEDDVYKYWLSFQFKKFSTKKEALEFFPYIKAQIDLFSKNREIQNTDFIDFLLKARNPRSIVLAAFYHWEFPNFTISFDATASMLQILACLTIDDKLLKYVNLNKDPANPEFIYDIYSDLIIKEIETTHSLYFLINRKLVKTCLMTYIYGSTSFTITSKLVKENAEYCYVDFIHLQEIITMIIKIFNNHFPLFQKLQFFLSKCGIFFYEKRGGITLTDSSIKSSYKHCRNANKTITVKEIMINYKWKIEESVKTQKGGSSITANCIHFLDGLVSLKLQNAFLSENKNILAIHDCFVIEPRDFKFLLKNYNKMLKEIYLSYNILDILGIDDKIFKEIIEFTPKFATSLTQTYEILKEIKLQKARLSVKLLSKELFSSSYALIPS